MTARIGRPPTRRWISATLCRRWSGRTSTHGSKDERAGLRTGTAVPATVHAADESAAAGAAAHCFRNVRRDAVMSPPGQVYDPAVRITAVGDCGVDRYLNLGRDRPGGITLNFAAEGFFDSVMDAPSPGLRAVD